MNVLTKQNYVTRASYSSIKSISTYSHLEIEQNSVSPLSRKKGFESKQRHGNHFIQPRRRFLWGRRSEAAILCSIAESGLGYTESQLSMSHRPIAFRFEDIYLFLWLKLFPQMNERLQTHNAMQTWFVEWIGWFSECVIRNQVRFERTSLIISKVNK